MEIILHREIVLALLAIADQLFFLIVLCNPACGVSADAIRHYCPEKFSPTAELMLGSSLIQKNRHSATHRAQVLFQIMDGERSVLIPPDMSEIRLQRRQLSTSWLISHDEVFPCGFFRRSQAPGTIAGHLSAHIWAISFIKGLLEPGIEELLDLLRTIPLRSTLVIIHSPPHTDVLRDDESQRTHPHSAAQGPEQACAIPPEHGSSSLTSSTNAEVI